MWEIVVVCVLVVDVVVCGIVVYVFGYGIGCFEWCLLGVCLFCGFGLCLGSVYKVCVVDY